MDISLPILTKPARIRNFPRGDDDNCVYSHDVVDLAKELRIYNAAKPDSRKRKPSKKAANANPSSSSFAAIFDKNPKASILSTRTMNIIPGPKKKKKIFK